MGSRKGHAYARSRPRWQPAGVGARPVRHEERGSPREGSRLRTRVRRARLAAGRAPHRFAPRCQAQFRTTVAARPAPPRLTIETMTLTTMRRFSRVWEGRLEVGKTPRCRSAACAAGKGQKTIFEGSALLYGRSARLRSATSFRGSTGSHCAPRSPATACSAREEQKVKRTYGLLERQFRNYFEKAARAKGTQRAR